MGCLFEFLGELFLEVFLEGSITLLGNIFPSASEGEKKHKTVRTVVMVISCLLVFAMFFGAIMLLFPDNIIEHNVGLMLLLIPAGIIILYVVFCVIGNITFNFKKRKK